MKIAKSGLAPRMLDARQKAAGLVDDTHVSLVSPFLGWVDFSTDPIAPVQLGLQIVSQVFYEFAQPSNGCYVCCVHVTASLFAARFH